VKLVKTVEGWARLLKFGWVVYFLGIIFQLLTLAVPPASWRSFYISNVLILTGGAGLILISSFARSQIRIKEFIQSRSVVRRNNRRERSRHRLSISTPHRPAGLLLMCSVAFLMVFLISSSATPAYATVTPTELTVTLAPGATTMRTIIFTNPKENIEIVATAQAFGVSDEVMILQSSQKVAGGASVTFALFIQAVKEESGFITISYDGSLDFIPITIKFSENASQPTAGSGYLAITYDLYVDVGTSTKMIIRDAGTKEAILSADVVVTQPTEMTITAVAGVAEIPIEENGIWTGRVEAPGYRAFNFVMVAKGEVTAPAQVTSITSTPSPMIIGQPGQVTAVDSSGKAVSSAKLLINGIEYSNPAVIYPTTTMITVEVRDSKGNRIYGPSYLTASQQQQQPTTPQPEGGINLYGVAILVIGIAAAVYFVYRRRKYPKLR